VHTNRPSDDFTSAALESARERQRCSGTPSASAARADVRAFAELIHIERSSSRVQEVALQSPSEEICQDGFDRTSPL
jgi:hypothetical protein